MKLRTAMIVIVCVLADSTLAQTIPLDQLLRLDARFQSISSVSNQRGEQLNATVSYQAGDAYTLLAPRTVQQLDLLIANGTAVRSKQAFATLRGPELHHFLLEFRVNVERMRDAKRRFDRNKVLYEKNAISAQQWKEISADYYEIYLEHEHMQHFYYLVLDEDEERDQITIAAPIDGRISFSTASQYIEQGEPIASFIPEAAIRLHVLVPLHYQESLHKLSVGDCELAIDERSSLAEGFFIQAWTEPLTEQCPYMLGQTLLVTPKLEANAYKIPKSAVFRWSQRNAVFVLADDQLTLAYIKLIGEEEGDYIATAERPLHDQQVLSSSISAVQGILLGLGGE